MNSMETYLEEWYKKVHEAILKTDIERYEELLSERKEKLDSYQGVDKKNIFLKILSRDEDLKKMLAEKAEVIKRMIIADDEQREAINAYKLYE